MNFFSNLLFCNKLNCLLYLKKKSFFNIEDICNILYKFYNIKDILQCRFSSSLTFTRHISRSREEKNPYFYLHAPDELLWHVGWVSVLQRIKSSSTVCTVFCLHYIYSITSYFMYESSNLRRLVFSRWALLYLPSQLRHCILYLKTCTF